MEKRKTGLVIAIVALAAVLAIAVVAYNALAQSNALKDGTSAVTPSDEAPRLEKYNPTVYTENNVPFLLTEIADGKPLVVNFWATWCPYCIQEMGDYQQLYNEYGNRVSFAFVDCVDGQRETVADGASWLAENGYTLPAYYDVDQDAVRDFGATSLPTTVVASADGEILAVTPGVIDPERMRAALDSLLAT